MTASVIEDRTSQLLIASDRAISYDEARSRLERASLYVTAGEVARAPWAQALLLSIAASGTRMFRGGVFVDPMLTQELLVGRRWRTSVVHALQDAGCRIEAPPESAFRISVGPASIDPAPDLYCWAEEWAAIVSPKPPSKSLTSGNELSGILAGAMAVTEAFRKVAINDLLACRRQQKLDLWQGGPVGPIQYLPGALWLIGLGNLGQANLLALSLLPFEDPSKVLLLLQDDDVAGPENLAVQVLTTHAWVGEKKSRFAAAWAEARGFKTIVSERRFTLGDGPRGNEPRIALVGVDNLEARRAAASSNFDFVVDAGLGATGIEAFDIRVHSFPGARNAHGAWPQVDAPATSVLPAAYRQLIEEGRLDQCGAMTIAGQSVGVPSTALAAAAIQLTQICRCIASGSYSDLFDACLRDPAKAVSHTFNNPAGRRIPHVRAYSF